MKQRNLKVDVHENVHKNVEIFVCGCLMSVVRQLDGGHVEEIDDGYMHVDLHSACVFNALLYAQQIRGKS